jgi:hypothetical protein
LREKGGVLGKAEEKRAKPDGITVRKLEKKGKEK